MMSLETCARKAEATESNDPNDNPNNIASVNTDERADRRVAHCKQLYSEVFEFGVGAWWTGGDVDDINLVEVEHDKSFGNTKRKIVDFSVVEILSNSFSFGTFCDCLRSFQECRSFVWDVFDFNTKTTNMLLWHHKGVGTERVPSLEGCSSFLVNIVSPRIFGIREEIRINWRCRISTILMFMGRAEALIIFIFVTPSCKKVFNRLDPFTTSLCTCLRDSVPISVGNHALLACFGFFDFEVSLV